MVGFLLLASQPANFVYAPFVVILILLGLGIGMLFSPNNTSIMNSVPARYRGVASGMRTTIQMSGNLLSMSLFFSVVIIVLAGRLPTVMSTGLVAQGIPPAVASHTANLPPTGAFFAAFLGYNPMQQLLPASALANLPATTRSLILGKEFFPHLI